MSIFETVLSDASVAIEWLEEEDDPAKRRILYTAAISLLYAVSDTMDRDEADHVRAFIQGARLVWKQESLDWESGRSEKFNWFYDFIRAERHKVIHEAIHSHSGDASIPVVSFGVQEAGFSELQSDIYWPLTEGPLEGIDARDALKDALDWWKRELQALSS